VPDGSARVPVGHPHTAQLNDANGVVSLEGAS